MRLQLRGATTSPEQQRQNDRHSGAAIVCVLALLAVYAFLFTPSWRWLNVASPRAIADSSGVTTLIAATGVRPSALFDKDGSLACKLYFPKTSRYDDAPARLIFFGVLTAAFLSVYLLPLQLKKKAMVFWFHIGFLAIFGLAAAGLFLAAHLALFLIYHPKAARRFPIAALIGALPAWIFAREAGEEAEMQAVAALFAAAASHLLFALPVAKLLARPRAAAWIRRAVAFSPLILAVVGAACEGSGRSEWQIPLGFLFFLWQWDRLLIYYIDHKDGEIPEDLPVFEYLAVFLCPGGLARWTSSPYVGQGYSYMTHAFYSRDKNEILLGGVGLLGLSLLYMLFFKILIDGFAIFMREHFAITVYEFTSTLVSKHAAGERIGTATVLLSTLSYQVRVFLVFGAICHFRVGIWRILGFWVAPQYNKPWLATNLVSLWGRFAFHYRELLVRAFYYPTFFRFFKKNRTLRIFFATLVASAIGNLFWGKIPDRLYDRGITLDNLVSILRGWPYYVLLGLGISLTQAYLMRRGRTRKPWKRDRWFPVDVLCAYGSIQFFCLIHIFARPVSHGTLWQQVQLFLIGFGIHL